MKKWKRIEPTITSKVGFKVVVSKTFELPNGTVVHWETENPVGGRAVCVLPLTDDNKVVSVRQFRAGPETIMDDIPGGYVDEAEDLEAAARRELLEETGYEPGTLSYLGVMHYSSTDNMARHCFLATGCKPSAKSAKKDLEEQFAEMRLISIDELIAIAKAGKMTDPGAVLLAYDRLMELKKEAGA